MDKSTVSRRISSISNEIGRLNSALFAMNTTDIQRYPDNFEVLSTDAALRAELIACRLRHLLYASTSVKKPEYLASAAVMQGVTVQYEDGVLTLKLPCLIPGRKERRSSEYLLGPIHYALKSFSESHPMPQFQHCVVCFSHVYSQEQTERRVRDYDNLEMKQLLDVLASFILVDDNGLLCDAYNTTETGDTDCTCISVMSPEQFPKWLEQRQKYLKTISDF